MAEWWAYLTLLQQIYYFVAILSTALIIIQAVRMLIGLCGHALQGVRTEKHFTDVVDTTDANTGFEDFRLFTMRGVSAFLFVAGWGGVALLSSDTGIAITVIVSVFCGFGAMLLIAHMFGIKSVQDIGNCAVGIKGRTCLLIPASRAGKGKVRIRMREHMIEADAVTDGENAIRYGAQVEVCGLADGNTFIVRKAGKRVL